MGAKSLDLLKHLGLLKKTYTVADLMSFSDDKLKDLLINYVNEREKEFNEKLKGKFEEKSHSVLLSPISHRNNIRSILPYALVFNRIVIDDPLAKRYSIRDDKSLAHLKSVRGESKFITDLNSLRETLSFFVRLKPLIEDGLIEALPLTLSHTSKKPIGPLFSEDNFKSELPDHIYGLIHDSAIVTEVSLDPLTGYILDNGNPPTTQSHGIQVEFKGDHPEVLGMFFLHAKHIVVNEKTHELGRVILPVENLDVLNAWVIQSINRSVINRLKWIGYDLNIAQTMSSTYVTESEFETSILQQTGENLDSRQRRINAVNFLKFNCPYLILDSVETISKVRNDNQKLFEQFQYNLLGITQELSGTENDFEERARILFEKEVRPQIDSIKKSLDRIKTSALKGGLMMTAEISLALLFGNLVPFSSILGLPIAASGIEAIQAIREYIAKQKTPAFIWNKISRD